MKTNQTGYIYVIKSNQYYKIGKAKSPKSRTQKYITENPNEIEVILCEIVCCYSEVEKILHETFSPERHNREWFLLTDENIKMLKEMITWYKKETDKRLYCCIT